MGAGLQRRAQGVLCALTALVLLAVIGGYVVPQHHDRAASLSHSARLHVAAAPGTTPVRGVASPTGVDLVPADGPSGNVIARDTAAGYPPATGPGGTSYAERDRAPPAGALT